MNGSIIKGVSSALPRVFSRRSAILKIFEEKALERRLFPRILRFPVPLDKGNGSAGNKIGQELLSFVVIAVFSKKKEWMVFYFYASMWFGFLLMVLRLALQ